MDFQIVIKNFFHLFITISIPIHINVLYNANVKFNNTLIQFKLTFENYIKLKCV